MSKTVSEWMKSSEYLPEPLRDFHAQKDLFKAIHQSIDVDEHSDSTKGISWVSAHIYVIDIFLWYMARRGYTLQRTNKRGEFRSLSDDVTEATERRTKSFASLVEGKQP